VPDVTIERSGDDPDELLVIVQAPTWVLQFRAPGADVAQLGSIRDTDWAARRVLHVGTAAGTPVHWCLDGDTVTALVGDDDETWDVAVLMPVDAVDRIVRALSELDQP
jgi:hypothetical protein